MYILLYNALFTPFKPNVHIIIPKYIYFYTNVV